MSVSLATAPDLAATLTTGLPADAIVPELSAALRYSAQSTVDELPGYSVVYDIEVMGEELGGLFSNYPELPGVILFSKSEFFGVISQAHFYKRVSRAFGREIYYRRPANIMLEEADETLLLTSDCPIPTAVERCLSRPTDFVYEPFLVHDEVADKYKLCAVQTLLLASSHMAALRNRQMEQILDSVTDGLLVVDREFRIGTEYSKVTEKIFERADLSGGTLPGLLEPLVDAVTREQLEDYLKILFDPKLIDRLIKTINPAKQISLVFTGEGANAKRRTKHLAFHFERIRTQSEISQILVRVEDVTPQVNLAKELEQQEAAAEENLQFVMQILQAEPASLQRYVTRFEEELPAMMRQAEKPDRTADARETVHALFRQAHSLKGEASLLRLIAHERGLHRLEDGLEKLRGRAVLEGEDLALLLPMFEGLRQTGDKMRSALEQLKSLRVVKPPARDEEPLPVVEEGLIRSLDRLIGDLSKRLNKPAHFHATIKEEELPNQHRQILGDILTHLARNSMVHGIERVEERKARGKSPAGVIQLALRPHDEFDEIIFQDDGGGLNFEKIRRRAEQLGWKLTTEQELRDAIFEPGFSTAEQVTELAGRGVGLDAIRNALQVAGGRISSYSEEGVYCAFQILLPKAASLVAASHEYETAHR